MVLGDRKQAELWVCFHPVNCQDRLSRVVDEVMLMSIFVKLRFNAFAFSSEAILCLSEHTIALCIWQ